MLSEGRRFWVSQQAGKRGLLGCSANASQSKAHVEGMEENKSANFGKPSVRRTEGPRDSACLEMHFL
jgi:hypothetical protein